MPANDGSEQSPTLWPIPKFRFLVRWESVEMSFQEISGLDAEVKVLEYRHSGSNEFSVIKMPGMKKYSDVTMKKGVLKADNKFWEWFNEIKMNTIKRKTVTISLLDEAGNPTMVWTLQNAFPMKIQGTDLKSTGD